ncbi:UNVERIFIED_CONTAM: hypothetical protein Slati_2733500 [Sesamum latifolium]|uniref:Uncharacterized protein n=1 Tax=Sesamum latifolium TaxID=2727402 RepID=A0AAW2VWP5_9LAMI
MLHGIRSAVVLRNGWRATVYWEFVCHHNFSKRNALVFIFWGSFYLVLHILQALLEVLEAGEPLWRDFLAGGSPSSTR